MPSVTDNLSPGARNRLVERIDAWLPQTQCTRCGYPRCRAYAEAIAAGEAEFNQCPPGGEITLRALAELLQVPPRPLNPANGRHGPRERALIDEARCIGCRKCLDACPVDAIVGARKLMHTVLTAECNGCGLCLPPCPVDCIVMAPVDASSRTPWPEYDCTEAARWRRRAAQRMARLEARTLEREASRAGPAPEPPIPDTRLIREEIRAAVERVKARKHSTVAEGKKR